MPALTADGTRISVEFTVTLLHDDGAVEGIAAIMRDVSERHAHQRATGGELSELRSRFGVAEG